MDVVGRSVQETTLCFSWLILAKLSYNKGMLVGEFVFVALDDNSIFSVM